MTATHTPVNERPPALVEAALERIGGGVRVEELAYKTGLSAREVLDALHQLERDGRARPWAWTVAAQTNEGDAGDLQPARRSMRRTRTKGRVVGAAGERGGRP
jgi:hypothetical protein